MDEKQIAEIVKNNPQVDKKALDESIEIIREVRATGAKCGSISASPPVDPYSINRIARSSDSRRRQTVGLRYR